MLWTWLELLYCHTALQGHWPGFTGKGVEAQRGVATCLSQSCGRWSQASEPGPSPRMRAPPLARNGCQGCRRERDIPGDASRAPLLPLTGTQRPGFLPSLETNLPGGQNLSGNFSSFSLQVTEEGSDSAPHLLPLPYFPEQGGHSFTPEGMAPRHPSCETLLRVPRGASRIPSAGKLGLGWERTETPGVPNSSSEKG